MFSTHSFYLSDIGNTASQRELELLVSELSPLCIGREIFGEAYGICFYFYLLSTRRGHLSEVSWQASVPSGTELDPSGGCVCVAPPLCFSSLILAWFYRGGDGVRYRYCALMHTSRA